MELSLIKLLFYTALGVTGTLFVYVTALAVFLYNRIETVKDFNKRNIE